MTPCNSATKDLPWNIRAILPGKQVIRLLTDYIFQSVLLKKASPNEWKYLLNIMKKTALSSGCSWHNLAFTDCYWCYCITHNKQIKEESKLASQFETGLQCWEKCPGTFLLVFIIMTVKMMMNRINLICHVHSETEQQWHFTEQLSEKERGFTFIKVLRAFTEDVMV